MSIWCSPSASGTARFRRPRTPFPVIDTLIHVDANPQNLGRNVPAHVTLCSDARFFLDRLLVDGAAIARPACPELVAEDSALAQGRSVRGGHGQDHTVRRPDVFPQPVSLRA